MTKPKTILKHIPLGDIREPDKALRKVDKTKEDYAGLVESIRVKGIMNPITVRELKDEDTGETLYGLVDGLQRFNGAQDAGLDTIPAQVISCKDGELIEAQVMANVHKIETKPVEYSRALLKILQDNPLLPKSELATRLAKSGAWISERLGLLKLTDSIGKLVDEDKVGLSNAYALAKLPVDEQGNYVDRAMTMTPQQFAPAVNARVKELRDAKRKGKDAAPEEFLAIPLLRTRKELVAEMETPQSGPTLCKEFKPTKPQDAFALGIKWSLNMDPRSQAVQKARDEERRANLKKERETSDLERKRKRAAAAAAKATLLKAEAEEAEKETSGKKEVAKEVAAAPR